MAADTCRRRAGLDASLTRRRTMWAGERASSEGSPAETRSERAILARSSLDGMATIGILRASASAAVLEPPNGVGWTMTSTHESASKKAGPLACRGTTSTRSMTSLIVARQRRSSLPCHDCCLAYTTTSRAPGSARSVAASTASSPGCSLKELCMHPSSTLQAGSDAAQPVPPPRGKPKREFKPSRPGGGSSSGSYQIPCPWKRSSCSVYWPQPGSPTAAPGPCASTGGGSRSEGPPSATAPGPAASGCLASPPRHASASILSADRKKSAQQSRLPDVVGFPQNTACTGASRRYASLFASPSLSWSV
mmetsp:Transcript_21262/g.81185  ORF Transcript_21262/g.81185 Transcript_21262/m.81185 type:complete len:307 (-) Transcript_21262:548-1468(-)